MSFVCLHTHTHTYPHTQAHSLCFHWRQMLVLFIDKISTKTIINEIHLICVAVCCSVLQQVATCCSVLQCVAMCCSPQTIIYEIHHLRVALCCSIAVCCSVMQCVAVCCSELQCAVVCCSLLQFAAVCRSVSQCVAFNAAVCCSVLQCVAMRCSILQCIAGVLQDERDTTWRALSHPSPKKNGVCVAVFCSVLQCVAVCWCASGTHLICAFFHTHQEILRLDIPVDEAARMNMLQAVNKLPRKHQPRLFRDSTTIHHFQQVLHIRTEQLHHKNVARLRS